MTEALSGLSSAQVAERVARGDVNRVAEHASRSIASILRENIVTLFNGILTVCFIAVLLIGDPRDGFFYFIVVINAGIGIFQELRAKRELDRLALLAAPQVLVRRDGTAVTVALEDVVLDDVIVLRPGDQIPADALVLQGDGLLIDEAVLTGESDPVEKAVDDRLLSGSYVSAGAGLARATAVGAQSYVHKLTAEIKRYSLAYSELRGAVNRILVWLSWILGPLVVTIVIGRIFTYGGWDTLLATDQFRRALIDAVASIVGVIPEGLVLLTSLAFGVAALQLARNRVLVQELAAVEILARVDVLCLDKTGTLTTGDFDFDRLDVFGNEDKERCALALAHFGADDSANATARAIGRNFDVSHGTVVTRLPFSSAVKYAGLVIDFGDHHESWLLGAPDWLLARYPEHQRFVNDLADQGLRVLAICRLDGHLPSAGTPASDLSYTPVASVALREEVRPEARQTLAFFADQGVRVVILSGDSPRTVSAVVKNLGLTGTAVDSSTLPDSQALQEALETHQVFGRVRPEQKKEAVELLQEAGHTVAMTGDGVNDAMAIKNADLGIAMGDATGATKSVSRLVLMDNRFDRMPGVLAHGRRVIANIERVSNIFLSKTAYGILLALITSVTLTPFPFLPRQLSLVSTLAIGIPSFVLALTPNERRYQSGLLRRITFFSVPNGIIIVSTCIVAFSLARDSVAVPQAQSIATVALFIVSLWLLSVLARPLSWPRVGLLGGVIAAFAAVCLVPFASQFFSMELIIGPALGIGILTGLCGAVAVEVWYRIAKSRALVFDRVAAITR